MVRAAAFSPRGDEIAVLLERPSGAGTPRSEAILIDPAGGRRDGSSPSPDASTELAWSPDGSRLLLAWPAADQWLFVPTGGGTRLRAIGNIASIFSPANGDARLSRGSRAGAASHEPSA